MRSKPIYELRHCAFTARPPMKSQQNTHPNQRSGKWVLAHGVTEILDEV